jgi:predicted metalloendopeptidase
MHGFDPVIIDIAGPDDEELLTKSERIVYNRHVECLSQQYNQYCYKHLGSCLVSSHAIQDNFADVGGLKVAYAAYQMAKDMLGDEPPVPGLTQFTNDQLFFITFQRSLCTRNIPSEEELIEEHTTDEARAIMTLRNNPHFAAAFACPVGSPAAPMKSCDVWGDSYGTDK